jgi:hypothetical protein
MNSSIARPQAAARAAHLTLGWGICSPISARTTSPTRPPNRLPGTLDGIEAAELPQTAQLSPVNGHREPFSPAEPQVAEFSEKPRPER